MNKKGIILSAISCSVFIFISSQSTSAFATHQTPSIAGTQLALFLRLNLSSRHNDYYCSTCPDQDYQGEEADADID